MRHQAVTRRGLCEYVVYFVVVAQHVMKLEAVELVLQIVHGLTVRRHLGIHTVLSFMT
jgi:hypothetical protein